MSDETRATGWRKVATAIWHGPYDPQIYGDIEIDAEPVQKFIERIRAETSAHVTVTHVVGKAVADALALYPHLNTYLSRGRFVPHDSVDIFFVVSVGDGKDLSGVKVRNADRKSVVEIAEDCAPEQRASAPARTRSSGSRSACSTRRRPRCSVLGCVSPTA